MPSSLIYLTDKPVRIIAAAKQDLRLAVDVGNVDEIDLLLVLYEGTEVDVKVTTGMQLDTDVGWVTLVTFTRLTAVNAEKKHLADMLRYIRWEVTFGSASTIATFMLSGIARTWG